MKRTNDLGRDPVFKLVCRLAIPTMLAQLVSVLYSIVDRIYIGNIQGIGDLALAGVGVCGPIVTLLSSFASLVGLGGSPIMAMRMGEGRKKEAGRVLSNCFLMLLVLSVALTAVFLLSKGQLLRWFGASEATFGYADTYLTIYTAGTFFALMATGMNSFLIAQGYSGLGMATVMLGAVLNIVLDPVFIFALHMDVAGAAIATAFSNAASVVFFAVQYARLKGRTAVSFRPKYFTFRFIGPIFSVGLASALATALGNASNMVMVHLASSYGDIPVAACGIVKRIDQFPLNVSMGLCQGFMPLVGYNYAARNYERMRAVSYFSWKAALIFSACCVACFAAFAPQILHLFIPEAETSALGADFLRIACLAVPLTAVNFLISYTLQAMGKGVQSAVLTACRQGLLNIPLLILMNLTVGLYGMMWTQLVVEVIMLPVSLGMYRSTFRHLPPAERRFAGNRP